MYEERVCEYVHCRQPFQSRAPHQRFCHSTHKDRQRRLGVDADQEQRDVAARTGARRSGDGTVGASTFDGSLDARLTDPVPGQRYTPPARGQRSAPKGWEPGVRFDGDRGEGVTVPMSDPDPDHADVLRQMGLDPGKYRVAGTLRVSTWQQAGSGEWLYAYRASVERIPEVDGETRREIELLQEHVLTQAAPRRVCVTPEPADKAFVVNLADWQMGKRDGDGTKGTVERVLNMIDAVTARACELRLANDIGTLYVAGLGDLVEGCDGFYPMQAHTVELDRRGQVKVVRRLLTRALMEWAPLFNRVVVTCVPGNHGENRKGGKAFTTFADNDDVAVFEQVAEILSVSDDYDHVSFVIPDDELVVTLEVAGVLHAWAHGHMSGSGSTAQARLWDWWRDQSMGRQPAGDALILTTAHFHHFSAVSRGGRTHFQCPPLDGGSHWYEARKGEGSTPGTLTYLVGADGWSALEVL